MLSSKYFLRKTVGELSENPFQCRRSNKRQSSRAGLGFNSSTVLQYINRITQRKKNKNKHEKQLRICRIRPRLRVRGNTPRDMALSFTWTSSDTPPCMYIIKNNMSSNSRYGTVVLWLALTYHIDVNINVCYQ